MNGSFITEALAALGFDANGRDREPSMNDAAVERLVDRLVELYRDKTMPVAALAAHVKRVHPSCFVAISNLFWRRIWEGVAS